MGRFSEKTVFVTGASQGIGESIAKEFAKEGATVVALARNLEKLESLAAELGRIGGRGIAHALDLSDFDKAMEGIRAAVAAHGVPDVLVNNAGVTADNLILRMKRDEWDRVIQTNLTGLFVVTQEIVKGMIRRRSGRIINITSIVGLMGNAGQVNYSASKAGVIGFTKSLAREIGSRGITVNAVAPGYIETAMTGKLDEIQKKQLTAQIIVGRLGQPEDVAGACLFLASDDASYITGEVLNVSGGLYM